MSLRSKIQKTAALLALLLGFVSAVCASSIELPELKVGVILPLSAPGVGGTAQSAREGLELAQEQLLTFDSAVNKAKLKFIIEDDAFTPRQSILAARKLVDAEKVDVLITLWQPGTEAALPVIKGKGIIHLSPTRWMPAPDYDRDFVLSGSAESYAAKAVDLIKTLGFKKIAILVTKDSANAHMQSFLIPMLETAGVEVVDRYEANLDVRDFRPWIMRLKEKRPEAILQNAYMPTTELVLKQMKELDFQPLQIGIGNFFTEVPPELVEGACYILQQPDRADFVEAYTTKYGHAPRYPAANYYDAVGVLVEALKMAKTTSREDIADALRSIQSYEGAMGKTRFIAPNKLECGLSYFLFQDGKSRQTTLEELKTFYKR